MRRVLTKLAVWRMYTSILATLAMSFAILPTSQAQSQYYDKYAYIRTLPSGPISPRGSDECKAFASRIDKFVSDVEQAHDACLRIEAKTSTGSVIADATHTCSNSKCQSLHDARVKMRSEADAKKNQCQIAVAKLEPKQDVCKPPEGRSCANKCNGEWGMLCPFTTVCDPIKHRCEKAKL